MANGTNANGGANGKANEKNKGRPSEAAPAELSPEARMAKLKDELRDIAPISIDIPLKPSPPEPKPDAPKPQAPAKPGASAAPPTPSTPGVPAAKSAPAAPLKPSKPDAVRDALVAEAESELREGKPVHFRYLLPKEERGLFPTATAKAPAGSKPGEREKQAPGAPAPAALPRTLQPPAPPAEPEQKGWRQRREQGVETGEEGELISDVLAQSKKPALGELGKTSKEAPGPAAQEPVSGKGGLFGEGGKKPGGTQPAGKPAAAAVGGESAEDLLGLGPKKEPAPAGIGKKGTSKEAEGGVCANCGQKTTKQIFCPYCGKALCAKCSPGVTPNGDEIAYVCPHCGEKVSVPRSA